MMAKYLLLLCLQPCMHELHACMYYMFVQSSKYVRFCFHETDSELYYYCNGLAAINTDILCVSECVIHIMNYHAVTGPSVLGDLFNYHGSSLSRVQRY